VSYPAPPWHTHGFGVICPYAVRARDLRLPPQVEPIVVRGLTMGLLAYIEYRPPSPLTYSELIWMPAMVRSGKSRGYWVARMYVDDDTTLRAGRELWALPKTKAAFERRGNRVDVSADDGTSLSFEFRAYGVALPLKSRMATLQVDGDRIVRFRADFTGRTRVARAKVTAFSSRHEAWSGFEHARRLLGLASCLESFESTMQPPQDLPA
jgi:acetoacetate decarboxylase